jgi:hypothetical protein
MGMIVLACFAGGCLSEEAKNVTSTVAISPPIRQFRKTWHAFECIQANCPSVISCSKMRVPGFANRGMYRVTSLEYDQMVPSPGTGSAPEVRQISTFWKVNVARWPSCVLFEPATAVIFMLTPAHDQRHRNLSEAYFRNTCFQKGSRKWKVLSRDFRQESRKCAG